MKTIKQVVSYFPILLGISLIASIPIGALLTTPQYDPGGVLEDFGNILDYIINGTKLSYMFVMWPLGILLGMPLYLSIILPTLIILLKIKFETIDGNQILSSILGIIATIIIVKKKEINDKNYFIGKIKNNSFTPRFLTDFSIITWSVTLSVFLGWHFNHYILANISDYFKPSGGGFFGFPPAELVEYVTGLFILYVFLISFLISLFSYDKEWTHAILYISPAMLFALLTGEEFIFWNIIFFITGTVLAKLINLLISKIKRPNPPVVAK